ncbi:hypothetical protein PYW08_000333 [Mythimna loreyi]|uniref:Uncharacterized protein n=1 Tax=Mythimna loreyi TaxID=667449 RepID=A0ACC2RC59_9NEOP|nr:hypothetical protein PYW08_000333 [Mythimna loreyi]
MEYSYEEEEASDVEADLRPVARRTAKHIAAGEERPRINSSQQTTPTDGKYPKPYKKGDAGWILQETG